ncbi:MAG: methyltransferase domain-containing protein [Candidatus Competibacteraceae bacterium]
MFETRSCQAELLDDLNYAGDEMAQTLHELDVINRWLGGNAVILNGLGKILRHCHWKAPIRIADLGCGGGDILKAIYRWARRHRFELDLEGVDANAYTVQYAMQNTASLPLRYRVSDIFSDEFRQRRYDIIITSLFCHHFTDEVLVRLFRQWREQAQLAVLISDLQRHWFAYYGIKYLTALLSRSVLVKHDGPLSVLRAFKRQELERLLAQAGIERYELRWRWAFRYQLIIWAN